MNRGSRLGTCSSEMSWNYLCSALPNPMSVSFRILVIHRCERLMRGCLVFWQVLGQHGSLSTADARAFMCYIPESTCLHYSKFFSQCSRLVFPRETALSRLPHNSAVSPCRLYREGMSFVIMPVPTSQGCVIPSAPCCALPAWLSTEHCQLASAWTPHYRFLPRAPSPPR